jgi:hypothetical protein
MSLGAFLQVLGASLELLGLGTLAWGIAEARQRFTDRPSLMRRGWARTQRFAARFRKRKPQDVTVGIASSRLGHFCRALPFPDLPGNCPKGSPTLTR